jgi:hypothetical protein
MVSSALTIINIVLTLIASLILQRSLKDIEIAKQAKEDLNRKFDSDPSSVLQPDEFTRRNSVESVRPTKDQ